MLGLANVRVIHANDSKGALASHLDRHANIDEGQIGCEAFNRILTCPKLRTKPFILETPVDNEGDDQRHAFARTARANRAVALAAARTPHRSAPRAPHRASSASEGA